MPSNVFLINKDTISQFEDISANVTPVRIQNIVRKMQDLDLKLFLGHALYYDLIQYFSNDPVTGALIQSSTIPVKYAQIFNGVSYIDRSGNQINYEGMIPMMVYFTFARFIESDAVRYTATGPVVKTHDQATSLSVSDLNKIVQQQRSVANAHANEVEKFLWDNHSQFPLWRFNERNKSARQAGPRIRGIDRTDFNDPSGMGIRDNSLGYNDLLI